ncbi:hypothetical protein ABW21_db0208809 [Orbilia brochopaga]|nr:hypothetical protein ABW21_db0208809 [Drechslerella brochopaga]
MSAVTPAVTITTHNPSGTPTLHPSSGPITFPASPPSFPALHTFYTTHTLPLLLTDDDDISRHAAWMAAPDGLIPRAGTLATYARFAPGMEVPLHRTASVDFGVVIDGEIELLLPGGETKLLRRGDVVIQRETEHGWRNVSPDKEVLMLLIAISALPVRVGDQVVTADP